MFKRKRGFTTGIHDLKVLDSEIVSYRNGGEAIKLTVENKEGVIGTFNIFLNNYSLVDSLLYAIYDDVDDDENFDEKDFIGITIVAELKMKNNYFYIDNIKNAYIGEV